MSTQQKLGLVAGLTLSLVCGAVQAFDGYSGAFPWFGYGNNGPAAYSLGNIPAPPYFALHPPVYYSHPIPRTYGHSPFACNCGGHHAVRTQTRVVANPYTQIKPAQPVKRPDKQTNVAAVPLRIANPFYGKLENAEVQVLADGR